MRLTSTGDSAKQAHECRPYVTRFNRKTNRQDQQSLLCSRGCTYQNQGLHHRICSCAQEMRKQQLAKPTNQSSNTEVVVINGKRLGSSVRPSESLCVINDKGELNYISVLYDWGCQSSLSTNQCGLNNSIQTEKLEGSYFNLMTETGCQELETVRFTYQVYPHNFIFQTANGSPTLEGVKPDFVQLSIPDHLQHKYNLPSVKEVQSSRHAVTLGVDMWRHFPREVDFDPNSGLVIAISQISHKPIVFSTGNSVGSFAHRQGLALASNEINMLPDVSGSLTPPSPPPLQMPSEKSQRPAMRNCHPNWTLPSPHCWKPRWLLQQVYLSPPTATAGTLRQHPPRQCTTTMTSQLRHITSLLLPTSNHSHRSKTTSQLGTGSGHQPKYTVR